MSHLSLLVRVLCVCACGWGVTAFVDYSATTGSTLDCATQRCFGSLFICLPNQHCTAIYNNGHSQSAGSFLNAEYASSLDATIGSLGDTIHTSFQYSSIWCPSHGSCNVIIQGYLGFHTSVIRCPKLGTCHITCDGSSEAACSGVKVIAGDGAPPTILKSAGSSPDVGSNLRVICPDGTVFENDDFKLPSELVCPTTSTTTEVIEAPTPIPCSAEDSCVQCRDGAYAAFNYTTGEIVDAGGYCIPNQDRICVDVFTRRQCKADATGCPEQPNANVKPQKLQPVWYQTCQDGRKVVMGPDGCDDRSTFEGGMCAAWRSRR